jgi:intracellular sulfur oxidation DsrE/DsrF family protein
MHVARFNKVIMRVAACAVALLALSPVAAEDQKHATAETSSLGAPDKSRHRLILQINSNDPALMNLVLNNAANVAQYYNGRHEDVSIEVIAFGPGLHMLRGDTSPVKARIETMALSTPEISFAACGNTRENMSKAENKDIPLISEAKIVASGVVRAMELQEQGWAYVKP